MQTITLYIADADYDKVIQALSFVNEPPETESANASESKAVAAITNWIEQQVGEFSRYEHYQGFVYTPPAILAPQPWVQPAGAHDAYPLDAIVLHLGAVWQTTIADNVWEPGVYGWVQL